MDDRTKRQIQGARYIFIPSLPLIFSFFYSVTDESSFMCLICEFLEQKKPNPICHFYLWSVTLKFKGKITDPRFSLI